MVTQNHFVIPATVLEKFRSRGFPEGVTLTADHCNMNYFNKIENARAIVYLRPVTPAWGMWPIVYFADLSPPRM